MGDVLLFTGEVLRDDPRPGWLKLLRLSLLLPREPILAFKFAKLDAN